MTCDNADEDAFIVQSWEDDEDDDAKLKFPRDEASRLYSHRFLTEHINGNKLPMHNENELEEIEYNESETTNEGVQPLDTVAENRKNFTTGEFERAK